MTNFSRSLRAIALSTAMLASAAQAAPLTYQFKVWSPGLRGAVNPQTPPANVGEALGLLEPLDSADFGPVDVGQAQILDFRFTNQGSAHATDIRAAVSLGTLSFVSNSCGTSDAPVTVEAGLSCDMRVAYMPVAAEPLQGTLVVGGQYGNAPTVLTLTGQGVSEARGVLEPMTSADFGAVTSGASASRTFTFKNTGSAAATNISIQIPTVVGLSLASNTCGTTNAPVTVQARSTCSVVLTFGGSTASKLVDASLRVNGNFTGGAAELALSGSVGNFDSTAAWSTSYSSMSAPTQATLQFGTVTRGTATGRTFYVRNVGTSGNIAVGLTLSGDVEHFKLYSVKKLSNGNNPAEACAITNGQVTAMCVAGPLSTGASYPNFEVILQYAPTATGNHSVTITPRTNNGTGLPTPITFRGSSEFNPAATWSTAVASVATPTSTYLNFGTVTRGEATGRTFYVRNTGTHGNLAISLALSGDVSQFKLFTVTKISNGNNKTDACTIVNGQSTAMCIASNLSTGASYPNFEVILQYAPKETGNHSITVNPSTNNGTVLPAPLTFTGNSAFNPTAAWSTSYSSTSAPSAAFLNFGAKTVGSASSKTFYARNTGTHGNLAISLALSGDVSQFKLFTVTKISNGNNKADACTIVNGQSTAMCIASNLSTGASYPNFEVILQYAPKAAGAHSISITPTTNNGTGLPQPLVFTGTGQ